MTWAKIDDRLHSHPKAEDAGLEALGLWTLALSFCAAYLTDGRVTHDRVVRLAGDRGPDLADRLVQVGLWEVNPDGGWRFHDWADYQPTKAEVEADRAKKSAAGRASGRARGARSMAATPATDVPRTPVPTSVRTGVRPDVGTLDELRARDPVPSRPVRSTHTRRGGGDSSDGSHGVGEPLADAILAHLAAMPVPIRHLATQERAERFACAQMSGIRREDILAGITAAGLKLGAHGAAVPERPETLDALADHVGGFIANQKRIGRRGGAVSLDDPDGARRTLDYFGKVWSARKKKRYGAPDGDLEPAAKLWEYAKKCAGEAKLQANGRAFPDAEAHVRGIVGQYLNDPDHYVQDQDHPISLLISRLGRYELPPIGPAKSPIPAEAVAPIVRPAAPTAAQIAALHSAVERGGEIYRAEWGKRQDTHEASPVLPHNPMPDPEEPPLSEPIPFGAPADDEPVGGS